MCRKDAVSKITHTSGIPCLTRLSVAAHPAVSCPNLIKEVEVNSGSCPGETLSVSISSKSEYFGIFYEAGNKDRSSISDQLAALAFQALPAVDPDRGFWAGVSVQLLR
jgi:hypothetical protein